MSLEEEKQRYLDALHAMQSGVAYTMDRDSSETTPKHLRVGVNSALGSASAVARILMQKGVFTEEEYFKVLADITEEDVKSYELRLEAMYPGGPTITLR